MKQLELEGIETLDYPQNILDLMEELGAPNYSPSRSNKTSLDEVSYQ
jgi:hypothetical protein